MLANLCGQKSNDYVKRYKEKAAMKKMIKMHEEKTSEHKSNEPVKEGAVPVYLMEREGVSRSKVITFSGLTS